MQLTILICLFKYYNKARKENDDGNTIRKGLPLKDQIAANAVRRQLRDLSNKIAVTLQPIFVSTKLEQDFKRKEIMLSIVSQRCVVYKFACDLCDADYVGYRARLLHERIAEHNYSATCIGKHFLEAYGDKNPLNECQFRVLKKCHRKFDCLVYEMPFIKETRPSLETQSDYISTQRQFSENICSEDDLGSRTFETFVVKFLACLPLLGFRTSKKWYNCPFLTDFCPEKVT